MLEGYKYLIHRTINIYISRVCSIKRYTGCKGALKTTLSNEVLAKTDHNCEPSVAGLEVDREKAVCKKRTREELHTVIPVIFNEEFSKI